MTALLRVGRMVIHLHLVYSVQVAYLQIKHYTEHPSEKNKQVQLHCVVTSVMGNNHKAIHRPFSMSSSHDQGHTSGLNLIN